MAETEKPVWDAEPGDRLAIDSPDIGEVTVLLPAPRERTTLQDGHSHLVFVLGNGRMVGINVPDVIDVERCVLVGDADGFQHALVQGGEAESYLFTRRQPGQPDDWERRETFGTDSVTLQDD